MFRCSGPEVDFSRYDMLRTIVIELKTREREEEKNLECERSLLLDQKKEEKDRLCCVTDKK